MTPENIEAIGAELKGARITSAVLSADGTGWIEVQSHERAHKRKRFDFDLTGAPRIKSTPKKLAAEVRRAFDVQRTR